MPCELGVDAHGLSLCFKLQRRRARTGGLSSGTGMQCLKGCEGPIRDGQLNSHGSHLHRSMRQRAGSTAEICPGCTSGEQAAGPHRSPIGPAIRNRGTAAQAGGTIPSDRPFPFRKGMRKWLKKPLRKKSLHLESPAWGEMGLAIRPRFSGEGDEPGRGPGTAWSWRSMTTFVGRSPPHEAGATGPYAPGHWAGPRSAMRLREGEVFDRDPDRSSLVAAAVRAMQQALVDHHRHRRTWRQGGRRKRVFLDEALDAIEAQGFDLLELNEALEWLAVLSRASASSSPPATSGDDGARGRRSAGHVRRHGPSGLASRPGLAPRPACRGRHEDSGSMATDQ